MAVADQTGGNRGPLQGTLHDAWWSLYDYGGTVDPIRGPFQRLPLPDALQILSADDATEQLSESVRWAALTRLARSGQGELPGYADYESAYKSYLQKVPAKIPSDVIDRGAKAVHEHAMQSEVATPTEDICNVEQVVVDSQDAIWIFSEFQTKADHQQLADWVQPENWPKWGPILFKEMSPVGDPKSVRSAAGEWHGNYREVVWLAGRELHTILRCDVKDVPPQWVGMTYDLVHSVDDVLTVDRGFLLATKLPSGDHLVKALKIVGFKEPASNLLASLVCPLWTDFARQATRNAEALAPKEIPGPSHGPGRAKAGAPPNGADSRSRANPVDASTVASDLSGQWVQSMGETVNHYTKHAQDVGLRLLAGTYGREDAARDRRTLCVSLVRDWGRAWKAGIDFVNGVASIDVPSTVAGPAVAGGTKEFSTVAVAPPTKQVPLGLSDFSHVDSVRTPLKSAQLTLTPAELGPLSAAASVSVRIDVDSTGVAPGLYVGALLSGSGQAQQRTPAHVYVSKAQAAG
ncbi:MAG: hypothetical protein QOG36_1749 [Actinomycetota bacterium]|nr:hypothetical protein [Actinomycetota bacterium]